MKTTILVWAGLAVVGGLPLRSAPINLLSVNDEALSVTNYFNGQSGALFGDGWSGSYDLGVTGITSGGSSLPNPGNESSGSGSFYADHTFGANSWDLSGWASGTIDAGLGNPGSSFPTIANTSGVGGSFQFYGHSRKLFSRDWASADESHFEVTRVPSLGQSGVLKDVWGRFSLLAV